MVVVGAESSADKDSVPAVYVLVRSRSSWKVRQTLRAGSREDRFGRSVAVSSDGETIIVGDVREPPDGEGVAHVYVRSGSLWNETAKLEGPSADFTFGDTVAVSSDGATILVLSSDGGHVFARSGQTWKRRASLVPTRSYVFLTTAALSADGRVAVLTDDDVVGNVEGRAGHMCSSERARGGPGRRPSSSLGLPAAGTSSASASGLHAEVVLSSSVPR
ncbi:MAG: hypothetical protein E6G64_06530 [Actinobacteria bacterium]|nr:MAG: hypothetical protein E6G64_06530 [Actinomycetota bacterium]